MRIRIPRRASRISLDKRGGIGTFLANLLTPKVGMVMAALLAIQTVTIGYLANENTKTDYVPYRSVGNAKPIPVIRAVFSKSADTATIRDRLYDQGLVIVDGPNQFGEFFLYTPEGGLDAIAKTLTDNGLIERFVIGTKTMSR